MPSSRMSTRSPSKPRMMGRLEPGPKLRTAMPGSFCNASPRLFWPAWMRSNESSVVTALNASNVVSVPPAAAVTVTCSCTGDGASSKSTVTASPATTVIICRPAVRCSRCASTS